MMEELAALVIKAIHFILSGLRALLLGKLF